LGVEFEPNNPCTQVMSDPSTGKFKEEVMNEKVLSAIIEMIVPIDRAQKILTTIRAAGTGVDCVFSVDLITRFNADGTIPTIPILQALNWPVPPNGKLNLGLGRPLARGL